MLIPSGPMALDYFTNLIASLVSACVTDGIPVDGIVV